MTSIFPFPSAGVQSLGVTEDHLVSVLHMRRARSAVFGEDLFTDPAWDILLELFASELADRDMSVLDLANAIQIPVSTTARWIGILKERGLINSDLGTDLVHMFRLTPEGLTKLKQLLGQWVAAFVAT